MSDLDLSYVQRRHDRCTEATLREYRQEPCNKTAVAMAVHPDHPNDPYPVCVHHTRKDTALPLTKWWEPVPGLDILRDLTTKAFTGNAEERLMASSDLIYQASRILGTKEPMPYEE